MLNDTVMYIINNKTNKTYHDEHAGREPSTFLDFLGALV
jgi:hypothetical protein